MAAAERVRQVVALRIRGITFELIGQQLGFSKQIAHKLYTKALKAMPKADVEAMRKLEAERIADLRSRVWGEFAGRQVTKKDPNDPTRTITVTERPDPEVVRQLVDSAIKISRHEAMVFGLDEPSKQEVRASFGAQPVTEEEMGEQWARLEPHEQEEFMRLLAKMEGRLVEQPALEETPSIETTATAVEPEEGTDGGSVG